MGKSQSGEPMGELNRKSLDPKAALGIGIEEAGLRLKNVNRITERFYEQKERVRAQAEAILAHFGDGRQNIDPLKEIIEPD